MIQLIAGHFCYDFENVFLLIFSVQQRKRLVYNWVNFLLDGVDIEIPMT